MKFQHLFKIHLISSNLQNILESSSETCMWNLSPFREVNLFYRKMLTVLALWNIMKFQHLFKIHLISTNLQNILESSSETCMWNLSLFREVNLFHRKMLTLTALEISWNFTIFFKIHLISSNLHIGIIIRKTYWKFEPMKFHHQKFHACEVWTHSEKFTCFIKLAEHIGIIIRRNIASEIPAHSEKLNFFTEKCRQCRP